VRHHPSGIDHLVGLLLLEEETMRKPLAIETMAYSKLMEGYRDKLLSAAILLDQGDLPEEIALTVCGGQVMIGMWVVFACNYMTLTGIRPSKEIIDA
jgi:hypothetical protein